MHTGNRTEGSCSLDTYCPDGSGTAVCTPRKHGGAECDLGHECIGNDWAFGTCVFDNGDDHNDFRDAYCNGVGK